jgi:hypothetical protein
MLQLINAPLNGGGFGRRLFETCISALSINYQGGSYGSEQ